MKNIEKAIVKRRPTVESKRQKGEELKEKSIKGEEALTLL